MSKAGRGGPEALASQFAAVMAGLGPFAAAPRLAAGVSGGADSLALALLADAWARGRGGSLLALIVDHGLRPEAGAEAARVAALLAGRGIASRVLAVRDLRRGPGLAERARAARFAALEEACAAAGITDLLLGQHAADQAETVLIRALARSGPAGLAGMAALRETVFLRLLRPLLGVAPGALRAFLREQEVAWIEDPSNQDPSAQRARLRALRADRAGEGPATRALCAAARVLGERRARAEAAMAEWMAVHVSLRPEGFAILPPGPWPADALASLIRSVAGAEFAPPPGASAALAARPAAATLGGARLLPAGRLGPGWLLAREEAALAPPVAAAPGAVWDNRFRLSRHLPADAVRGLSLGALGGEASRLRGRSRLPFAVLRSLPALRRGQELFAVPHLGYPDAGMCGRFAILPACRQPAVAAPFMMAAS